MNFLILSFEVRSIQLFSDVTLFILMQAREPDLCVLRILPQNYVVFSTGAVACKKKLTGTTASVNQKRPCFMFENANNKPVFYSPPW